MRKTMADHQMMYAFLPFILFLSFLFSVSSARDGDETDRLALLSVKAHILSDPYQIMTTSWTDSIHFCNWTGVVCGRRHQRVVALNLQSGGFVGSISPAVGNLSFLRKLFLYNNSFTGNIPQEVGRLSRLRWLSVTNNSLSGEIPSNISQCLNLVELELRGNNFTGVIPNHFELLTKLQLIDFRNNNLTGEIPKCIGNLTSLVAIDGSLSSFHGSIPDTLGQLSNLKYFGFGINYLSGILPPSLFNLSSLLKLELIGNQIGGNLPTDIAQKFPRLTHLNLPSNNFSGTVPVSLSNASNLIKLALNTNALTGSVPKFDRLQRLNWLAIGQNKLGYGKSDDLDFVSSLTNCTNLGLLDFTRNNLGGLLPKSMFNLTQLTIITIGYNLISGNIPSEIGQLVNIERLFLHSNQFTGIIPDTIGNLRNLKSLFLFGNSLSGSIPLSFGNLTQLIKLYLEYNNLNGTVPSSLSNNRMLQRLTLNKNNLEGYIPKDIFTLSSLTASLDLSDNQFVGSLPSEVGSLQNLASIDVSNNMMSGVLPDSLGSCKSLVQLSISGNTIQGEIPETFSSLKGLEVLDLSLNNLTGKVPEYLGNFMFLKNLNLSFNNFEGKVPELGAFENASIVSINGNDKLCGGVPEFQLPECTLKKLSRKHQLPRSLKVIIPTVSTIFLLILAVTFYLVYKGKYGKKVSPESNSNIESFPPVSYRSLQKATNGFSSENLIGSGKFSSVYKAILPNKNGSQVVSVKILKLAVQGAHKTFIAECEALRKIRHRNLVKIITSCSGVDSQGNDFKALIYAYMVNGSLDDWLHQNWIVVNQEIEEETRYLNFLQRLNIVIDVASALVYIHCQCGSPLVHCDLKPSNVLLDSDLVAHLGDFGLARVLQYTSHDSSASHASSLGIRGTIGYTAPEYGMGGQTSIYGDIYSFGIFILETFTGKRPTHEMFSDGLSLHGFVKTAIPDQVMEITDPIQLRTTQDENTHDRETYRSIKECLTAVYQIGITCSMESPRDRIDISNVFHQLQFVKKTFLEGRSNLA